MVLCMLGYAAHRFLNEAIRIEPTYALGLTLSQWISVGIFAAGVLPGVVPAGDAAEAAAGPGAAGISRRHEPGRRLLAATPLAKKLGYKPGFRVYLDAAPDVYAALVAPLPEGVEFVTGPEEAARFDSPLYARPQPSWPRS